MEESIKRLFFGVEVTAPWPHEFPKGRLLSARHRHMTLAFLGNVSFKPLQERLADMPKFPFHAGISGAFDACLPLPPRHPNVIAWHVHWFDDVNLLRMYQRELTNWLVRDGYSLDKREWLPHVTLCRKPFDLTAWKKAFQPLPFYLGDVHLYESVGGLEYVPIMSYPQIKPFEELDHTADIAFLINAVDLKQLYLHSFCALAFKFPLLLHYFKPLESVFSLEEIIMALNELISKADSEVGCGLKAVCYHGDVITLSDKIIQWEMIVDV